MTRTGEGCFILGTETDEKVNKEFVKSEINHFNGSYRSPYTQDYYPTPDNKPYISPKMAIYERNLNVCFDEYASLMYLDSASSVYSWETNKSLISVFFIKKSLEGQDENTKGELHLRVTISSDFKSSKNDTDISTAVEIFNNFVLDYKADEEMRFKMSGLIDQSVSGKYKIF